MGPRSGPRSKRALERPYCCKRQGDVFCFQKQATKAQHQPLLRSLGMSLIQVHELANNMRAPLWANRTVVRERVGLAAPVVCCN